MLKQLFIGLQAPKFIVRKVECSEARFARSDNCGVLLICFLQNIDLLVMFVLICFVLILEEPLWLVFALIGILVNPCTVMIESLCIFILFMYYWKQIAQIAIPGLQVNLSIGQIWCLDGCNQPHLTTKNRGNLHCMPTVFWPCGVFEWLPTCSAAFQKFKQYTDPEPKTTKNQAQKPTETTILALPSVLQDVTLRVVWLLMIFEYKR